MRRLEIADFKKLFPELRRRGYSIIGPKLKNSAIMYSEVESADDLPQGVSDEQEKGFYRVSADGLPLYFNFNSSPHSWKQFLFPPRLTQWRGKKGSNGEMEIKEEPLPATRYAFLGVRACDLHAITIQDKILMNGKYVDPHYKGMRERAFVIVTHCTRSTATCFCVSMNTGPKARDSFDLALTEVYEDGDHFFTCEAGSERGHEVLDALSTVDATDTEVAHASKRIDSAAASQTRRIDNAGIKELLYAKFDDAHWDAVANRCLSCTNCTLVCPTCFCSGSKDVTDLLTTETARERHWDSCFQQDHSYIHGGSVRETTKSRYRQWMTHKLGSWIDQFGESGCVGCGRCIAWCPVGIDITEEATALRGKQSENIGT